MWQIFARRDNFTSVQKYSKFIFKIQRQFLFSDISSEALLTNSSNNIKR